MMREYEVSAEDDVAAVVVVGSSHVCRREGWSDFRNSTFCIRQFGLLWVFTLIRGFSVSVFACESPAL